PQMRLWRNTASRINLKFPHGSDGISKGNFIDLINPLLTKEFAKSASLRKTKTDQKDTLTIAHKCFLDRMPSAPEINPDIVELKRLSRHRSRMGKYQTNLKVQYTRVLDLAFPELTLLISEPSLHLKYVYALLSAYPST